MNATVFAGMAQYIVLQSWPEQLTLSAIVGAGLIAAMVCSRFLLIGASMRPWFGQLRRPARLSGALSAHRHNWICPCAPRRGRRRSRLFVGSGVMVWFPGCCGGAGLWLGASLGDPRAVGLDLVMPVFFAAMLVPLWRARAARSAGSSAAAGALAVDHWVGGCWDVLVGALAGSVAGGLSMIESDPLAISGVLAAMRRRLCHPHRRLLADRPLPIGTRLHACSRRCRAR